MRDILIVAIVLWGAAVALRRPWVGVMLWTWLSIGNPHRYTWGFAYDAPLAAIAAAATMLGLLATRDRKSPFIGRAPLVLALFTAWMTLSWLAGLDPGADYPQWTKVMKINLMVFVALALLDTKKHIIALVWVAAGSLAFLGGKGGIFTILNGGNYKVWGPPGSFISDNNAFALALVMTIPLVYFLREQLVNAWARRGMLLLMVLVAASALGSHSRGGLLAIAAMSLMLVWRSKQKVRGTIFLLLLAVAGALFMPEHWFNRMGTIENYDEDKSALGRISAWWVAWRLAFDYPLGVGFNAARAALFEAYSPYPELGTPAAHSIYFQVLGHHGFVGLFLFLLLWLLTWRTAGRIRREARAIPQAKWCVELAGMAQVSLVGYLVGGAFLSLSYFDLPYYIMVMVVLTLRWVRVEGWKREPQYASGWRTIPGLAKPVPL